VSRALEWVAAELARRRDEGMTIAGTVNQNEAARWGREARAYDTASVVLFAAADEPDGVVRVRSVAELYRAVGGREARDVWLRVAYLMRSSQCGGGW
jgi:hypothetical protein